jgi:chromosome segregation ATPase
MSRKKVTAKLLCLLVCLLVLTGCDRSTKEMAIEEAEKAKAELVKAEAAIKKLQNQRNQLKEDLDTVSENWRKDNSELTAIKKAHNDLLNRVGRITEEWNSAINKAGDAQEQIQELSRQLREKNQENQEYQEWIKELQATIDDLENQISQMSEQFNEELDEEITDGNNV